MASVLCQGPLEDISGPSLSLSEVPRPTRRVYYGGELTSAQLERRERERAVRAALLHATISQYGDNAVVRL